MISAHRLERDRTIPPQFEATCGPRLAVWQTGLGGLDWLDELVRDRKAIHLGGNGYPVEYAALARHIIPRLRDEPPGAKEFWTWDPGDILGTAWLGRTTKDLDTINACQPEEWLLIRAWDES